MKILLIYPRISFSEYPAYTNAKLGLMYLSSYLKKNGFKEVQVIDLDLVHWNYQTFCTKLREYAPDIVGIQCMSPNLESVYTICTFIRNDLKKTKIVLGGPHFNSNPAEIFDYFDIDFVVHGEGEKTLLELAQSIHDSLDYRNIDGLLYRDKNGEIIQNRPRALNYDLDSLPFPDYGDLYDGHAFYGPPYSKTGKMASMMTTRGCPFNCSFCDVYNIHGNTARTRSVENVIEEIKMLKNRYGVTEFFFKDSNFNLDEKWVAEFSDNVLRNDLKISFFVNYRIEMISDSLVKLLQKAGCTLIFCGVESITPNVQTVLRKHMSVDKILQANNIIKKYGIKSLFSFMFGSPNDTEETLIENINFAIKSDPFIAVFTPTTVFPGTYLYDYAVKHNLLADHKWYFSFLNTNDKKDLYQGRIQLDNLPPEKVGKYIQYAFRKFYLRPKKIIEFLRFFSLRQFFFTIVAKYHSVIKMKK